MSQWITDLCTCFQRSIILSDLLLLNYVCLPCFIISVLKCLKSKKTVKIYLRLRTIFELNISKWKILVASHIPVWIRRDNMYCLLFHCYIIILLVEYNLQNSEKSTKKHDMTKRKKITRRLNIRKTKKQKSLYNKA